MPGKYGPYDIFEQVCDEISKAEMESSEDVSQYEQALVDESEINEIVDELDKIYWEFVSSVDLGTIDNDRAKIKRRKEVINNFTNKNFGKEFFKIKDTGGYTYLACSGRVIRLGDRFHKFLAKERSFTSDKSDELHWGVDVFQVNLHKEGKEITMRAPETEDHTWLELDFSYDFIEGEKKTFTILYDAWKMIPPKYL